MKQAIPKSIATMPGQYICKANSITSKTDSSNYANSSEFSKDSLSSQEDESLKTKLPELLLKDVANIIETCQELHNNYEALSSSYDRAEQKIVQQRRKYSDLQANYCILEGQKRDVKLSLQKRLEEEQLKCNESMSIKEQDRKSCERKINYLESELSSLRDEFEKESASNAKEKLRIHKERFDCIYHNDNPVTVKEILLENELKFLKTKFERMVLQSARSVKAASLDELKIQTLKDELKLLKSKKKNGQYDDITVNEGYCGDCEAKRTKEVEEELRIELKEQKEENEELRKCIDLVRLKIAK